MISDLFLLTPLREGRLCTQHYDFCDTGIFLLTPLREGRLVNLVKSILWFVFLLTPLREGRHGIPIPPHDGGDFYSRPCVRGDESTVKFSLLELQLFLLTPLREGRHTGPR